MDSAGAFRLRTSFARRLDFDGFAMLLHGQEVDAVDEVDISRQMKADRHTRSPQPFVEAQPFASGRLPGRTIVRSTSAAGTAACAGLDTPN